MKLRIIAEILPTVRCAMSRLCVLWKSFNRGWSGRGPSTQHEITQGEQRDLPAHFSHVPPPLEITARRPGPLVVKPPGAFATQSRPGEAMNETSAPPPRRLVCSRVTPQSNDVILPEYPAVAGRIYCRHAVE